MRYRLTRDVTIDECSWLDRCFLKDEIVYSYPGPTYGCISDSGFAFTEEKEKLPFFELPLDSIEKISQ